MKVKIFALTLALASLHRAHAQSAPTATQLLQLSGFAAATGTLTGLDNAKNIGVTAGIDLGIGSFARFHPSVEIRGTYPIYNGKVDSQKLALAGIKIDRTLFRRYHPYVDFFYGRGEITYEGIGYPSLNGQYYYVQTPSNVYAPGGGVDIDLTRHFALKADAQLEHYQTPVTASGGLYATAATIGFIYRVELGDRKRRK